MIKIRIIVTKDGKMSVINLEAPTRADAQVVYEQTKEVYVHRGYMVSDGNFIQK